MFRSFRSKVSLALALGAVSMASRPARALQPLQPLQEFLNSAKKANTAMMEATANVVQQDALADVQLGRALPGINLRGTYTHNQYDAEFPYTIPAMGTAPASTTTIIIQPYNEFDAYLTLNVPLVDLAQFKRISAARKGAEVTKKQLEATMLQIDGVVAQDYYQLVANLALVEASKRQLDVAKQSLALTQDRFTLGATPELDVDRSKAEVERQVQQLASAELQRAIAERALRSASGLAPILDTQTDFTGDLHEEAALDQFEKAIENLPQVQAAALSTAQAEANATAQKLALAPTLAGSVTEHLSNAPGFTGSDATYQILLALTWSFDFTNVANIRAQNAALDVSRARELAARISANDAINTDWNSVKAAIARSQSARAEVAASKHAADTALDRYKAGAATQLDWLQAQRDAFSAEVARIQADADLANSRAQLRLSVGETLVDAGQSPVTNSPQETGLKPK